MGVDEGIPKNIEAEMGVLAGMIADENLIPDVFLEVRQQDFYRDAHQTIFGAIRDLYAASKPVSTITLAEELERRNEFKRIGGDDYLREIMESVAHEANTVYYAQVVRQKAIAREVIGVGETMAREGRSNQYAGPELAERAEKAIFAVMDQGTTVDVASVGELVKDSFERMEQRHGGEVTGLSSGINDLDEVTCGFQPKNLIIIGARPSMGKAQPLDAKVLTPYGFKLMGEIRVGDEVIGANGKPCRVIGVYPQGGIPVYQVTMSDGGATECCEDHLWFTQTRNERRRGSAGSVKSLKEISYTLHRPDKNASPNHAIPVVGLVEFAGSSPLKLDPYAMGLLLGDGSFSSNSCTQFSNPEPDLQERLRQSIPPGDTLSISGKIDFRIKRIVRNNEQSETKKALAYYGLDGMDSYTKFIPSEYLLASTEDRIALLRGLMDTDGYVTESRQSVEYTTSSPALAACVASLARSLGGVVSTRARIPHYAYKGEVRTGAESFRMVLCFPNGLVPVSSAKHLKKWKGGPARYHRNIVSIEPIGDKPCQCIKVDAPDQLYVTDDFIVTHNTAISLNIAEYLAFDTHTPVLFVSLEMTRNELVDRLLCSRARVDSHRFRIGHLSEDERGLVYALQNEMQAAPLFIDDASSRTVIQIGAVARRVKLRHGLGMVIVDYAQLVEPDDANDRRNEQVAKVGRGMKRLARELGVPVLLLSQLNRQAEQRDGHRPRMSDLKESGDLEQDADIVLLLHRDEYYDAEKNPGQATVIVGKNRNGRRGDVEVSFQGATMRFADLAKPNPNF